MKRLNDVDDYKRKRKKNNSDRVIIAVIVSAAVLLGVIGISIAVDKKSKKTDVSNDYVQAIEETTASTTLMQTVSQTSITETTKQEETTVAETTKETVKETEAETTTEATVPPETKTHAELQTEAPTEGEASNPDGQKSDDGWVYSNIGCYCPYTVDAEKAQGKLAALNAGTSYAELFSPDICYVGDSVVSGFSSIMGFDNVQASVGAYMASHLPDSIPAIVESNPESVVIRYGLNEMSADASAADGFASTYGTYISQLKEALPNTKIIVCGLFPIGPNAVDSQARFNNVPAYNAKVRDMCVSVGVAYYENPEVFLANKEGYSGDEIHVGGTIYRVWLADMALRIGL